MIDKVKEKVISNLRDSNLSLERQLTTALSRIAKLEASASGNCFHRLWVCFRGLGK